MTDNPTRPTGIIERRDDAKRIRVNTGADDRVAIWIQVEGVRWTLLELTTEEASGVAGRLAAAIDSVIATARFRKNREGRE